MSKVDTERREAALVRLGELGLDHPALREPEARQRLSGALPLLTLTEDDVNDEVLNLRVPEGTKQRAEGLLIGADEIPEIRAAIDAAQGGIARAPRLTASLVLRLALLRGLDQLEREQTRDGE